MWFTGMVFVGVFVVRLIPQCNEEVGNYFELGPDLMARFDHDLRHSSQPSKTWVYYPVRRSLPLISKSPRT
jgi:hypothetical protein